MSNKFMALVLDAPMQSWGDSSKLKHRKTRSHPTRSGISGMMCAALGVHRGSEAEKSWLAKMANMKFVTIGIPKKNRYSGKELKPKLLVDYHTVMDTMTAKGPINKNAVETWRHYLTDAVFGVIVEGPGDELRKLSDALQDPVWGIWFGRKCCIPAAPVFRGISETFDEACGVIGVDDIEKMSTTFEADSFEGGTDTINDVPVNFKTREYRPRRISHTRRR